MNYLFANNVLEIKVDTSLYNDAVLFKCFYWYTGKYDVQLSRDGLETMKISLRSKAIIIDEASLPDLIAKIQKDLIDFKLRDVVANETRTIRELLVAKAFSHFTSDQNPTSEVSDPVGFSPDAIIKNQNESSNS